MFMNLTLVSAHCPTCAAPRAVARNLPSHGATDAAVLVCDHTIVIDYGTVYGTITEAQWQAALGHVSSGSYLPIGDAGRTPGFATLCAQLTAAGVR